jgi:uroporphyrinogen-III synthase
VLQSKIQNVIITSKNAVEALLLNLPGNQMQFENIYCVGRKTKRLVEKRIGTVKHVENSARKLADYLVEYLEGLEVTYFCSDLRLDDLPAILTANNIEVHEVETYKTKYAPVKIPESADGVLFFSPSTVQSYLLENKADKIAFCIGETTAAEARNHFKDVRVASLPTAEDLIRLVNKKYDNSKAKPASNASGL